MNLFLNHFQTVLPIPIENSLKKSDVVNFINSLAMSQSFSGVEVRFLISKRESSVRIKPVPLYQKLIKILLHVLNLITIIIKVLRNLSINKPTAMVTFLRYAIINNYFRIKF